MHSSSVVLDPATQKFETLTTDRGTFVSLTGDAGTGYTLSVKEAENGVTYQTAQIAIAAGTTVHVVRNGAMAAITDLAAGDTVLVVQNDQGVLVAAFDASHQPPIARPFGPVGPRACGTVRFNRRARGGSDRPAVRFCMMRPGGGGFAGPGQPGVAAPRLFGN